VFGHDREDLEIVWIEQAINAVCLLHAANVPELLH
jgi:hypothetical protein